MLCVCVFMRVCVVILSYNIDTSRIPLVACASSLPVQHMVNI